MGLWCLLFKRTLLWNTIYMEEALKHLKKESFEIKEEDEARLSPLVHGHVNVLGHYSFTLAESVLRGELRPLNEIREMVEVR